MIHRTNSKLYKKAALHDIPQNTPFIFWDTCALLDILRIPYRQENVTAALTKYQQLYEFIENDRIISLTSDMVLYEFNSHFDEISNELSKEVRRLKESIGKYVTLMSDIMTSISLCKVVSPGCMPTDWLCEFHVGY